MNDNTNPPADPSPSDPEFILSVAMERSGGVTSIIAFDKAEAFIVCIWPRKLVFLFSNLPAVNRL